MKKKWLFLVLCAGALGFAAHLRAATSDALTVTMTPNATYEVDIDTDGVVLDFPSAALGTNLYVVLPATVTINSTLAPTELSLNAALTGGWSLGSTDAQNVLQAWALFTSTNTASIPAVAARTSTTPTTACWPGTRRSATRRTAVSRTRWPTWTTWRRARNVIYGSASRRRRPRRRTIRRR